MSDAIRTRLARGDRIHMQYRDGARTWWFDAPYQTVADKTMQKLLAEPDVIVEAGDSLFGLPNNSQTFLAADPKNEMVPNDELVTSHWSGGR